MIYIAGRRVTNIDELSDSFGSIIPMMVDAGPWLKWALHTESVTLQVATEADLLQDIQQGLHGTDVMCVPSLELLVNPARLMEVSQKSLGIVGKAAASDENAGLGAAQKVLRANDIYCIQDLDLGREFLADLGVASQPMFRTLDLGELCALRRLADNDDEDDWPSKSLRTRAAGFAAEHTQTPTEFINGYLLYRDVVGTQSKKSASKQAGAAEGLWARYMPLLNDCLETIMVSVSDSGDALSAQVETALYNGFHLGFSTKVAALRGLAPRLSEDTSDFDEIFKDYMMDVNCAVRGVFFKSASLSQDGRIQFMEYVGERIGVMLACNRNTGTVTIVNTYPVVKPKTS